VASYHSNKVGFSGDLNVVLVMVCDFYSLLLQGVISKEEEEEESYTMEDKVLQITITTDRALVVVGNSNLEEEEEEHNDDHKDKFSCCMAKAKNVSQANEFVGSHILVFCLVLLHFYVDHSNRFGPLEELAAFNLQSSLGYVGLVSIIIEFVVVALESLLKVAVIQ
jgi:Cu/Ag efflux pump CusA